MQKRVTFVDKSMGFILRGVKYHLDSLWTSITENNLLMNALNISDT